MPGSVELDTSALVRATRGLTVDLERGARAEGIDAAEHVAAELRADLPVRSGRLRNSVRVERGADDAAVSYGAGVPYAGYIDKRTHATEHARDGADRDYQRRCQTMAEREARKV